MYHGKTHFIFRTCFSLQLDGTTLDNFAELKTVEGLKEGSLIKVDYFLLLISIVLTIDGTICPGSSDLLYRVTYYIK